MKKMYVGPKQLTIENTDFFDYSVTLFGNNDSSNISYSENTLENVLKFEYWNPDNNQREIEVYNMLLKKTNEQFEIMAHDNRIVSQCDLPNNVKVICKNDDELIELLNNKMKTRKLFCNDVPMLKYTYVLGKDFNYDKLCSNHERLVVQHPLGSGGSKTFICDENNWFELKNKLIKEDTYIISNYMENNIPYNIHCIIGKNQIEIFPPSMQELDVIDKIEYIGSFYDIKLTKKIKNKFREYTTKICLKLQKMGYRGVLGIDYIYVENELYFIEINPRFQGSTRQLDKLLIDNNG